MATGYVIRANQYFDSVFLMRAARRISEQPGVIQAAALMGTDTNKELLAEIGVGGPDIAAATPNDLILTVIADDEDVIAGLLDNPERWLQREQTSTKRPIVRTLDEALASAQSGARNSNLAVISVPGDYAAYEARHALERGLNVFLFSDNVAIEDELSLKQYAHQRGLVVMGPDCGTAIIRGVGIGFANVVRRGPIGAIAASGTGLQELTTLVHRAGSGISHAIGTGSHDLSDVIGGITTLDAFDALEADTDTRLIAVLSKPPGANTLARLMERIDGCSKPVVACFLGIREIPATAPHVSVVRTLDDVASKAVQVATGNRAGLSTRDDLQALARRERARMKADQRYVRGIFAGGTFCYQAQQMFQDAGIKVYSNAPLKGNAKLPDPRRSLEHSLVDMGADEFTQGRPHPMIDSTLRGERILAEARDPQVAVLLLDFILGYGSAAEPAGDLADAIVEAKRIVSQRGGYLSVVASVCGTDEDPQGLEQQTEILKATNVIVLSSSTQAALFSRMLATEETHEKRT